VAGLLAWYHPESLPIPIVENSGERIKDFPCPFRGWGVLYSYGDSSGIEPDSLLIRPDSYRD